MAKVIIGIGVPGAGKTTVLHKLADEYGYTYISPDDLRKEFGSEASDKARNKEIWLEAYSRVRNSLENGKSVVFDATFASQGLRKSFLDIARTYGAEKIQGVYVSTPTEIARERNLGRERQAPEHVFDSRVSMLKENPPEIEDGFDSLFTVDAYQRLYHSEMLHAKDGEEEKKIEREFPKLK